MAIMAAFSPVRSESSTAQVEVVGQFVSRSRGRICVDQFVCFVKAIYHPPPGCVMLTGKRASESVSGGDVALVGWKCSLYSLLRKMCARAPMLGKRGYP